MKFMSGIEKSKRKSFLFLKNMSSCNIGKVINLEKVAQGMIGELGEPCVAECNRCPGVDAELLTDGQVFLKVLSIT